MNRISIYSLVASLAALSTGCNDFLDRQPYVSVDTGLAFSNQTLAESVVTGVYSNLLADYTNSSYINWDAMSSVLDAQDNWLNLHYSYLLGTIQPTNTMFSDRWKRLYEGVSRANDVINNINATPDMSEDLKKRRISECKFLRAYHYYRLNCLWRGVPIYLENVADAEYTRPRATEAQVWDQCLQDLTDCIECESLPGKIAASSSDYGRVTKGAAYALRGRIHMWKKNWKEAESDLRKVGELGFSLFKGNYADLFKEANEKCDEMVFSVTMTELSGNGNVFSSSYGNRVTTGYGNTTFFLNTNFVNSYQWADGRPFSFDDVIEGYSAATPEARSVYFLRDGLTSAEKSAMSNYGADMTKYLDSGNEARLLAAYEGRDPRLAATAITPYSTYQGGSTGEVLTYTLRFPYRRSVTPDFDVTTTETQDFLYCIRKFVTVGREYTNILYNPVDVPVIRYAQVLLNIAECLNEQGNWKDAVTYVNMVRSRAGVAPLNEEGNDYVKVTGCDDMRRRIQDETRWELACEEVIYNEELRWGVWHEMKFGNGNGLQQAWGSPVVPYVWGGDSYNLWPVPSSEIEKNPSLVQNPGWY